MIIPHQQLDADTLEALLEEFITREGTEYGATDVPLSTKVKQLHAQLVSGEIRIVFDPAGGTTSLVPSRELRALGLDEE